MEEMRDFSIYNTLTRKLDKIEPLEPPKIRIYCCGPTVYDFAHIGNFRTYMFQDLFRRSLEISGYEVEQVVNLTDVDDKTIRGAEREGKSLDDYTGIYIDAFFDDLEALRIEKAEHYPRATRHIDEMLGMIGALEKKGLAYKSGDSVYYKVSGFRDYGKLAHLDTAGMKDGARVDHDEYDRESVRDFVLWKGGKDEQVKWESPWGEGRPGWHMECSAMGMKYLGETIDIHCGGVDLVFPHHENEIAQSEGATGKQFVRYWVHSEHLLVENQKMSKSLGNFFTFRNLVEGKNPTEKKYSPTSIRYLLLSTHYRSKLNFTFDGLDASAAAVDRLREFKLRLDQYRASDSDSHEEYGSIQDKFREALADDLNISEALAVAFNMVREVNRMIDNRSLSAEGIEQVNADLAFCDSVLCVLEPDADLSGIDSKEIDSLVEERNRARADRNFARADEIRDKLAGMGIILEDGPQGTRWKIKG